MCGWKPASLTLLLAVIVASWGCAEGAADGDVSVWRVPDGGRLPQAVVDDTGTVHLIYFQGEELAGDLFYVTRGPGQPSWSEPERVNSEASTVTGLGPIDGGQIALGKNGRLHVAWLRMRPVEFFYTRTNESGVGFEEQFGLATGDGVEAGPALAADDAGNVFMFWHAGAVEDAERAVYMSVSHDDGLVWDLHRQVNDETEGACNCCNVQALADGGAVYVSYRGAGNNERRGQRLLTSRDAGDTFTDELIQPWELRACPVSTTSLTKGPSSPTVAWETDGQVFFATTDRLAASVSPDGSATMRRKHPALAVNSLGDTLIAWGDGRGLRSGGTLHWQIFDANHEPISEVEGDTGEIPDGSVPVALTQPDDSFVVVY